MDMNADPISVAARAAELSLEQHDRLRVHLAADHDATSFYSDPFEVKTSNTIASLMSAYAVLMGYVTKERAENGH